MKSIVLLFAASLCTFAANPLAAQRAATPEERIAAARERVAQSGIPVALLETRVAEGRAKGVAVERIALAVERRAAGLVQANEALVRRGVRTTHAELSAGADAVEAGVDGASLRAVIQAARAEDGAVALAVLGELARQGLPVAEARGRVTEALRRGGGAALTNLPQQAAAERGGRPPAGNVRPPGGGRPDGVGRGSTGPPAGVPAAGRRPEKSGGPPAKKPKP
ncbi:hypothetical protein BH23GEM6_BH23GEM6_18880 [soil metagenome]